MAKKTKETKKGAETTAISRIKRTLPSKRATEKLLAERKARFLEVLEATGVVAEACRESELPRRTAYDNFATDPEFAANWIAAVDTANDELITEARTRATKNFEPSDTLLIYLLNHHERQQKWRTRLISCGNIALKTVQEVGTKEGLTEHQIATIINAMTTEFNQIALT